MTSVDVYVLWDDVDGTHTSKIYKDMFSAQIALNEAYTDYWIDNGRAKINTVKLVSYKEGNEE